MNNIIKTDKDSSSKNNIIPIASGKGGVGKSVVSTNLAASLALRGNNVILCDLDLGAANLHTILGLKNNSAGFGHFIQKQELHLSPLLQETGITGLRFLAGDCLFPGTANMDFFIKKKLIKELSEIEADYLILDLGAGATFNTLDFFLLTHNAFIVSTLEVTSILNAYSFIKAALFRYFFRIFPPKSGERNIITEGTKKRMEGVEISFADILNEVASAYPESGKKAFEELSIFRPQIILNMGKSRSDLDMATRLRSLVKSKLNLTVDFTGFIPTDDSVSMSIAKRVPAIISFPNSNFVRSIQSIAEKIMNGSHEYNKNLYDSNENSDITAIEKRFFKDNAHE